MVVRVPSLWMKGVLRKNGEMLVLGQTGILKSLSFTFITLFSVFFPYSLMVETNLSYMIKN
jgi:hypothetical protein